jgi:hypothetical protein
LLGLVLAREAGLLLAWDAGQRLYLWNRLGQLRARLGLHFPIAAAAISDDGSRVLVAWERGASAPSGAGGELWWLDHDLNLLLDMHLPLRPLAVALEPLGLLAAVSSHDRRTTLLSKHGKPITSIESIRPLHYLRFPSNQACMVGAADFGLIAAFDISGQPLWRHAPVLHAGGLCEAGEGRGWCVAQYSAGVGRYAADGTPLTPLATPQPCRLVQADFDGTRMLVALEAASLALLKSDGEVISTLALPDNAQTLALGPLGDWGAVGLPDGRIMGVQIG